MNLSSHNWSLTLDLNGGRITELSYLGIKIFGTYQRIDGKLGNSHLCVPSFDKEGIEKYKLPFHGLVRNNVWNVERRTKNRICISVGTQATATYPASLKILQTFTLGNDFIHNISVQHFSGEAVPVNIGVHYYWDTPEGWNMTAVNSQQSTEKIMSNGFIALEEKNVIQFPHAKYSLISQGFENAVLWTSFIDSQEEKRYSQDFCCIEPVIGWPHFFGSEKSFLKVGDKKDFLIKLCAGERT